MARAAKLTRKRVGKHTYWATQAGCPPGKPKYFGNAKELKRKDAEKLFLDYLQSLHNEPAPDAEEGTGGDISCWELAERYLAWALENLAAKNYSCKKTCLDQWCNHTIESHELAGYGGVIGDVSALDISALHLAEFLTKRKKEKPKNGSGKVVSEVTLSHNQVHVKACWSWAANPRKGNLLPKDFAPFAGLPKVRIPAKAKSEFELLTDAEYRAFLKHADADLGKIRGENGRYRRRKKAEYRRGADNPYRGFADVIRFCYAAGPRTSEVASLRVRDVHLRTRQVTLGRHKRTTSMNNTTVRDIQLNDDALTICKRLCRGKRANEFVFTQANGKPWTQDRLDERFRMVRRLVNVRDDITIYSFRHLWISDMMEDAEIPVGTIASMAGTSIDQIEKTYGHFRNQLKAEAQARLDARRAKRGKKKRAG